MESFRLCWQVIPGGRIECLAPMSKDAADFRLRAQSEVFPYIRCWIVGEYESLAPDAFKAAAE